MPEATRRGEESDYFLLHNTRNVLLLMHCEEKFPCAGQGNDLPRIYRRACNQTVATRSAQ